MTFDADVIVVGSGPAGALAASRLLDQGLRVRMLDVAHDDDVARSRVPDLPFSEIRRSDPEQHRYFLGEAGEGVPTGEIRVGAQLTAPRQFVTRDADRLLPVRGDDFEPMQSLALGGLGAAWGAAAFTWTPGELRSAGIGCADFSRYYDEVASRIGVSGAPEDDASALGFAGVREHQPALEIDSGAERILEAYLARRDSFRARGLHVGRTPLAVLSRPLGDRSANPYFDMDFWSDSRRSVFRPRYLVEDLERSPGFRFVRGQLVTRFEDVDGGVLVRALDVATNQPSLHRARRLLLCAGAINSARIALHSLDAFGARAPILCNPYLYMPCIQWRMLGRSARDRRHSLSQLVALYEPRDAPDDLISVQLYGYRSLLLFKLAKEMPLPGWAGVLTARVLLNSLVIAGLHHSDAPGASKSMRIEPRAGAPLPEVVFEYTASQEEGHRRRSREDEVIRLLRSLGLLPFARMHPGAASSIHYAGTLPIDGEAGTATFTTDLRGCLRARPRVFVGDSATFRHLPAKGLTFTIMANALRVAEEVARDIRSGA